jgi:hypothetical protein
VQAADGRGDRSWTGSSPAPGHHQDLRWIYLHMIEKGARHNGHADILRERIDGTTGL